MRTYYPKEYELYFHIDSSIDSTYTKMTQKVAARVNTEKLENALPFAIVYAVLIRGWITAEQYYWKENVPDCLSYINSNDDYRSLTTIERKVQELLNSASFGDPSFRLKDKIKDILEFSSSLMS